jgi:hypothetical protein
MRTNDPAVSLRQRTSAQPGSIDRTVLAVVPGSLQSSFDGTRDEPEGPGYQDGVFLAEPFRVVKNHSIW